MENLQEELEDDGTDIAPDEDYSVDSQQPLDLTDVRIAQRFFPLGNLITRIESDELILSPGPWRRSNIWNDGAQSRLIESLLIQIPIPTFFFNTANDNKWLIVDGVQRLTALARFVLDDQKLIKLELQKLTLCELEFLTELNGKTFDLLEPIYQRRIKETRVTVYSIDKYTPPAVKYKIFKRISTDDLPRSAQEIRNALYEGQATKFLTKLAGLKEFSSATHHSEFKRRADHECILRFIAFTLYTEHENRDLEHITFKSSDGERRATVTDKEEIIFTDTYNECLLKLYKKIAEMGFDEFLNSIMDPMNKMMHDKFTKLEQKFKKAMVASNKIFGEHAFRKVLHVDSDEINSALYEVWSVNLGQLSDKHIKNLIEKREYLISEFHILLNNTNFKNAISSGKSNSARKVQTRFRMVKDFIEEMIRAPNPQKNTNIEEKYPINSTVSCKIVGIVPYGAFAELEMGLNGLIHKSQLSWTRRKPHPSEIFKVGDAVKVVIQDVIQDVDSKTQRVSLSYKRTKPDPWKRSLERYEVGSVVQGTIVSIAPFGAFAELEEDVEGLIHISKLARTKPRTPQEIVSIGDKLKLKVIDRDVNDRRIDLSLKAMLERKPQHRKKPSSQHQSRQQRLPKRASH